jgi:hypothetical protein
MTKKFLIKKPEIYRAYDNARSIIDYGVRHEKDETATTNPK